MLCRFPEMHSVPMIVSACMNMTTISKDISWSIFFIAAWPRGKSVGLAIRRPRVQVPP